MQFFVNFSKLRRTTTGGLGASHGRPMGAPWAHMGVHGRPMGAPWAPHGRPMGAHGRPMGAPWAPHVLCLQGKATKNIKNGLNGVEVAPFGVSLSRNGVPGGAEPLGLLPRPILGLFFFFSGFRASGPRGPGAHGIALLAL